MLIFAAAVADVVGATLRVDRAVQADGTPAETRLIARDVCAWPALTRLRDGTLLIANFNRPSHGRMVGDVDTWASTDGGKTWGKRAPGAPHEPGTQTNRMNVAFGALPNGEVLLLASGWSLKPDAKSPSGLEIDKVLRIEVVEGDITQGKGLYQKECGGCHGRSARGRGDFPMLVGQYPRYMKKQIDAFRRGDRPHDESESSKGTLMPLTETDVQNILAYLTSIQDQED